MVGMFYNLWLMVSYWITATILGFSVSVPRSIQNIAAQNGVPIFTSNVIYRLIEDVRSRLIALLPVTVETKVVGEATVLQLFDIQLKSKQFRKVAGCRVINGVVEKQKHARVVRSGQIVHEGTVTAMISTEWNSLISRFAGYNASAKERHH